MRKVLIAVVSAWVLAFYFAPAAYANSVHVCPPGVGAEECTEYPTIREAVANAPADSVIRIADGVYTEANIEIADKNLTLRGEQPQETIIQAANRPCATEGRVFTIRGARVQLENMTIRNGCLLGESEPLAGAGIWNSGALSLKWVVMSENEINYAVMTPTLTPRGGAIYSVGWLQIDSSSFLDNRVVSAGQSARGGAIYNNGAARVINSTISGNSAQAELGDDLSVQGGGIYNAGALTAEYNTVVYNQAGLNGEAMDGAAPMEMTNNLLLGNTSGAGATGVNLGPLLRNYRVPVYIPSVDSDSVDAANCAASSVRLDQLGDPRGQGNGCDLGSTERGKSFVPLLVRVPPMPELRIADVTITPAGTLDSATKAIVSVVIENIGSVDARRGMWIDLYINPRAEPPNQAGTPWSYLCRTANCAGDKGITWQLTTELLAGERLTLTSQRTIDPFIDLTRSQWNEHFDPGDVEIWTYLDSWGGPNVPWGWVSEVFEDNNRFGPLRFTVTQGADIGPFGAGSAAAGILPERPVGDE